MTASLHGDGKKAPALTIGFPVYNGERHVRSALDSILAQTYTDYEIIIYDNASTDGTEEICRSYAARDSRITYHRNEKNIGAAPNFNLAFDHATAPFFKWAAHDDILLPDYLKSCMDVMLADSSVVVCHSEVALIDDEGSVIREHSEGLDDAGSADAAVRFRNLVLADHWCTDVFGVIRRDVLAKTPRIARYVGSDRALLAELALYGRYHRIEGPLFQNRDHPRRSVHASNIRSEERVAWFDPSLGKASPAPILRCWYEYGRSVNRVPLPIGVRWRCYRALMAWFMPNRWAVRTDLEYSARYFGNAIKRKLGFGTHS